MIEFESGTHTPTVTGLQTGETISDISMRYLKLRNHVEFSLKFTISKAAQWTTTSPIFTLPTSDNIEDVIGASIAYGGNSSTAGLGNININDNNKIQVLFEKLEETNQDVTIQVKGSYIITNTDSDPHVATIDDLQIQYSSNNNDWHSTLATNDEYIRFRVGDTGTWSIGKRFAATSAGIFVNIGS